MAIDITGRNLDLTAELRDYTESKLHKLGRLVENLDMHVTLDAQKHLHTCTIVAHGLGDRYTAEVTGEELHPTINETVDTLARQLRKKKTSILAHRREGSDSIRHLEPDQPGPSAEN